MTDFAGLDVSDKTTNVCVVTGEGTLLRRDVVASDSDVLASGSISIALTLCGWC